MSSSDPNSKIDLLDEEKVVQKKMNKAHCVAGEVKGNGVLEFLKHVIFPLRAKFTIQRPEKYGGDLAYDSYAKVEADFASLKLHPADLKSGVAAEINKLIDPIRKAMEKKQKLVREAYP